MIQVREVRIAFEKKWKGVMAGEVSPVSVSSSPFNNPHQLWIDKFANANSQITIPISFTNALLWNYMSGEMERERGNGESERKWRENEEITNWIYGICRKSFWIKKDREEPLQLVSACLICYTAIWPGFTLHKLSSHNLYYFSFKS